MRGKKKKKSKSKMLIKSTVYAKMNKSPKNKIKSISSTINKERKVRGKLNNPINTNSIQCSFFL